MQPKAAKRVGNKFVFLSLKTEPIN